MGGVSARLCMALYLDGAATVDELYFPTKGWSGLTLRTFDKDSTVVRVWVSSATGRLDPPVVEAVRRRARGVLRHRPGRRPPQ